MTKRKTFSPRKLEARLKEVFGGKCFACQREINVTRPCEWDHEKELWEGGKDEIENLAPRCIPCHRIKSAEATKRRAKADRVRHKSTGMKRPTRAIPSPPKAEKKAPKVLPPRRPLFGDAS